MSERSEPYSAEDAIKALNRVLRDEGEARLALARRRNGEPLPPRDRTRAALEAQMAEIDRQIARLKANAERQA
jgi:hypothetical protein